MPLSIPALVASAIACWAAAALAPRLRWALLLSASYGFYALWSPYLPVVLAAVTVLSFWCGLAIERAPEPSARRTFAWCAAVLASVAALLALKYTGFLATLLASLAAVAGGAPARSFANPFVFVGVSYWALQVVSYVLDVERGVVRAERHLGRYALYLAFFPKLLQGPIERAERFLSQVREPRPLRLADLGAGLPLVAWGLFQKTVVADRLAPFVSAVYDAPAAHPGLPTIVATYLFAAQLLFDFAGYTSIALGVGRSFGIQLSRNFDAPYLAESVAEFWRRWHISFSSWILDYLFKPVQLGLRRWRTFGTPLALFVAFSFSGLWHGANCAFLVWGVLHGVFLSGAVLFATFRGRPAARRAPRAGRSPWRVISTFHLVCLAWVFFRATTVRDGWTILLGAIGGLPRSLARLVAGEFRSELFLGSDPRALAFTVALIAVATALPRLDPGLGGAPEAAARGERRWHAPLVRTIAYALVTYLIAFLGAPTPGFIYAQF